LQDAVQNPAVYDRYTLRIALSRPAIGFFSESFEARQFSNFAERVDDPPATGRELAW